MRRFLGLMQFLTRIPIKAEIQWDEDFYKSTLYFPVVGAVLGILYYVISRGAMYFFDSLIASLIVLSSMIILTGGLHLDGLGDTFDALYSYRDKERMLEIMKDSRLGTHALLAVVMVLLFKLAFIHAFISWGHSEMLILMPAFARFAQVAACYKTKSPREKGMGNIFIGKVSTPRFFAVTGIMVALAVGISLIFKLDYFLQLMFTFLIFILVRIYVYGVYKKIDGITGDILGCICELGELIYLCFMYLAFRLG